MNRIAGLSAGMNDSRKAIELHMRALALAQKTANVALQASTRAALGRLHLDLKQWAAARLEFEHALQLSREMGDKRGQATALLSLGKVERATSEDLIRTAAAIFQEIGDPAGEQAANELLRTGDSVSAKEKPA